MFCFLKEVNGYVVVANQIFEIFHDIYNERGEKQLAEYLEYYHQKKGYMFSFNFNKKKETGMKVITLGDKTIVEAVV